MGLMDIYSLFPLLYNKIAHLTLNRLIITRLDVQMKLCFQIWIFVFESSFSIFMIFSISLYNFKHFEGECYNFETNKMHQKGTYVGIFKMIPSVVFEPQKKYIVNFSP